MPSQLRHYAAQQPAPRSCSPATRFDRKTKLLLLIIITISTLLIVADIFHTSSGNGIVVGTTPGSRFLAHRPRDDDDVPQATDLSCKYPLALEHLQRVLLFGDSLTAGAYYDEGSHKLIFRAFSWAHVVQEYLRRWYCMRQLLHLSSNHQRNSSLNTTSSYLAAALARELEEAQAWRAPLVRDAERNNDDHAEEWKRLVDTCIASPEVTSRIAVSARGYPGRNSRELSLRLKRLLRKPSSSSDPPTLVVIMSGTNDVVGLRGDIREVAATIAEMHRDVRGALCPLALAGGGAAPLDAAPQGPVHHERNGNHRSRACGSVALLTPPLNYRVSMAHLGQRLPRGYCEGRNRNPSAVQNISHRRQQLHRLLLEHRDGRSDGSLRAVNPTCILNWETLGVMFGPTTTTTNNRSRTPRNTNQDDGTDGSAVDPATRALWSDCLHPTEEGYRRFGGILAAVLWDSTNWNVTPTLHSTHEKRSNRLCLCG